MTAKDAQGAHEPQGQVASIACFRPVSSCSVLFRPALAGTPGRLNWRRDARVSCLLPGAYGEVTGRQVVPGVLFLSCYLQEESGETRYSSSSRKGSAS